MNIRIIIPENIRCILKNGDKIKIGDPFLEKKVSKKVDILISKDLEIQPKKIFRYLKKFVGDTVKKDEVLAIKRDFFIEKKVLSPNDGIVKEVDHDQGKIILSVEETDKKIISAYFQGEVLKINHDYLEVSVKNGSGYQIKKVPLNFGGEVFYLDGQNAYELTGSMVKNKIVVAGEISNLAQSKIEALGGLGLVLAETLTEETSTNTVQLKNAEDLIKIKDKKLPYCFVDHQSSKIYFYE